MGYVYGNLGRVDSSPISGSSSSDSSSSNTPRIITEVITTTTIETSSGTKTWKGDPSDLTAIAAWKASYEPGYTSQIISPRDSGGSYTSDPSKIEIYSMISKEQQAKEIAVSLKSETAVPANIVQSLGKTLGVAVARVTHKDAPTGITDTKRITGDDTVGGNGIKRKIPAVILLSILFIIAFTHIRKS